ncbi:MAG: PilZ domain-containing protein [Candidatus Eremiobacteraeota bacterium]|nr:PilZ domain-containing protein [Candidatus Eremiobacteraeota bacterium]
MENRRIFARRECHLVSYFAQGAKSCVGEIQNISLGGLLARVSQEMFVPDQPIILTPQDEEPLEYEVCWVESVGGGFEMGLRYPDSVASFWNSWAADLLAGVRPTHSEVLERRTQVRLECLLEGKIKIGDRSLIVDILDIGGGGALLEMDSAINTEEPFELTIETPVRVGNVPCKVARAWGGDPALYGLEFLELKSRHHLALVRLLDILYREAT